MISSVRFANMAWQISSRFKTWDGFLLGQEIRRLDPHATLVYITSYGDLAYRTFQYHLEVFDYIVKEPEQLGERFLRIHRAYLAAADKIEEIDMKRSKLRIGGQECLVSRSGKALLRKTLGGGL